MLDPRVDIMSADMSDEMQCEAVRLACEALEKFETEKEVAAYIKKQFDIKYIPAWNCIVGCNFGSFVTHQSRHFIVFKLGRCDVMLFKSG